MNIEGPKYNVCYDEKTNTIIFSGKLRLDNLDKSFSQIIGLFDQVLENDPDQITLDVRQLEFLNSLGISTISKFIIRVRNQKSIHAVVRASSDFAWQNKSIINLKKLMPGLSLSWD